MYVLNITDDYDCFINCTDNRYDDIKVTLKNLLLSIPSSRLLLPFISLNTHTTPRFL